MMALLGIRNGNALASERKLFEARRKARLGQQDQLKQRIGQLDEQVAGLNAQKQGNDKELALIEQELQGTRDLWKKNLIPLNRLTTLEREEARLQGQGGQMIASAAATKDKIAETQLQILQIDKDLASDVAKDLRETDSKIGEYVERRWRQKIGSSAPISGRRKMASFSNRRPTRSVA
jgi:HlyD family secretion protein